MIFKAPVSTSPMQSNNWKVQTLSGNTDRTTPNWLLEKVRTVFGGEITLDPCPHPLDQVQAKYQYMLPEYVRTLIFDLSVARKALLADRGNKDLKAQVRSLKNTLDTALNDPDTPNGLLLPWRGFTEPCRVFANIPYGRVETPKWCRKHVQEYPLQPREDACIFLLPAEVGSLWYQEILLPNIDAVCVLKGRLVFGPEIDNTAPFWSMLTYTGSEKDLFYDTFSGIGWVSLFDREQEEL